MNFTALDIYDSSPIVNNAQQYNGRVNIADPPADTIFKMQERIAIKNKTTEYREALSGDLENTLLSEVFFSADNIQIIQNALRAGVYKKSDNKFVIAPQNIDILKVIMRSIFLQYAEHKSDDITEQVRTLNKLVLDYAIPNVYNEAVGYVKYREDQSTLVVPLELPRQQDRDFKELEWKEWV